jgi:gas vesicle structural protein
LKKAPEATNSVVITGSDPGDETSLLDILDHVLNAGVIIRGNLVISLAGVDLIYVGLDVILTSVETAFKHMQIEAQAPQRLK